jgi:hypothetical protein
MRLAEKLDWKGLTSKGVGGNNTEDARNAA